MKFSKDIIRATEFPEAGFDRWCLLTRKHSYSSTDHHGKSVHNTLTGKKKMGDD